jgi:RNA polymerase sigma factor (sigma-70 family)
MVGDHARAEDITQDVFISALRRMRETHRSIAFKPWIYEIARNACIDEFRRSRRAPEVSFEEGEESAFAARHVFVHAPAPHVAIESKQLLDDLCGAFGGLSENHHRVLVLRELEGLSYSEIAERLGMTRAMVESTLFRARRRLTEEYEELASGRRCARVQSLIEARGVRPLTSLGVRERRKLTRHLAHCEPCRRRARVGGVEESLLHPRRGVARIAALLPLPLLRWRRAGSRQNAAAQSAPHSVSVVQSLQNVAQLVDPNGPPAALGRAAAAAAAIALAGAGGGIVANFGSAPNPHAPSARPVAASRLPALSIANILTPVEPVPARGQQTVWARPGAGQTGSATVAEPPSGPAIAIFGPAATGAGDGATPASGSAEPGVAAPPAIGGDGAPSAPGTGPPPGAPGGTPGGSVSVPNVSAPQPSSGPAAPRVPSPPSGPPATGAPNTPSNPAAPAQAPETPSPSSLKSTLQSTPATVTGTASQVQQSAPPVAASTAVSPPPGD